MKKNKKSPYQWVTTAMAHIQLGKDGYDVFSGEHRKKEEEEERKKLQEKNINKLNPYKDRVKKYFPNGGEICTEGRKKGTKIVRTTTQISRNALTCAIEGH